MIKEVRIHLHCCVLLTAKLFDSVQVDVTDYGRIPRLKAELKNLQDTFVRETCEREQPQTSTAPVLQEIIEVR